MAGYTHPKEEPRRGARPDSKHTAPAATAKTHATKSRWLSISGVTSPRRQVKDLRHPGWDLAADSQEKTPAAGPRGDGLQR
jgi:hypothetical protein